MKYRTFETGAIRDLNEDKPDYEAFFSPLVFVEFGKYMHEKRKLPDGTVRDGDNWQKGIPLNAYMESAWRHFMDIWLMHRGYEEKGERKDLQIESLCAMMFNVMGYLHTILTEESK